MIKGNSDITDEEYDNYFVPYNNNFRNFMIKYIIPETFAFELANSYYRDCLCDATLEHIAIQCVICLMDFIVV